MFRGEGRFLETNVLFISVLYVSFECGSQDWIHTVESGCGPHGSPAQIHTDPRSFFAKFRACSQPLQGAKCPELHCQGKKQGANGGRDE